MEEQSDKSQYNFLNEFLFLIELFTKYTWNSGIEPNTSPKWWSVADLVRITLKPVIDANMKAIERKANNFANLEDDGFSIRCQTIFLISEHFTWKFLSPILLFKKLSDEPHRVVSLFPNTFWFLNRPLILCNMELTKTFLWILIFLLDITSTLVKRQNISSSRNLFQHISSGLWSFPSILIEFTLNFYNTYNFLGHSK